MRNTVLILIVAVGAGLIVVFSKFGTIDPCGILRAEVRQEAARDGNFGGFIASALPDSVIDAMLYRQYGRLTPGRCFLLAFSGASQPPNPSTQPVTEGANYDGQWIADVPIQGSCPASHMTLFVNGSNIIGNVVNSAGTFAVTGQVDRSGDGNIKIVDFSGRIKFKHDQFAADYFNSCGERRVVGKRLVAGNPD
jgi:hypothetical protein